MSEEYGSQPSQYPASGTAPDSPWKSVLAYFFGILGGIIVLLTETRYAYHYFHAWQSLALGIIYIIGIIPTAIIDAIIGLVILWLIWTFIIWCVYILCMIMAYQNATTGKYFKLPLIGNFAERRAERFVAH